MLPVFSATTYFSKYYDIKQSGNCNSRLGFFTSRVKVKTSKGETTCQCK